MGSQWSYFTATMLRYSSRVGFNLLSRENKILEHGQTKTPFYFNVSLSYTTVHPCPTILPTYGPTTDITFIRGVSVMFPSMRHCSVALLIYLVQPTSSNAAPPKFSPTAPPQYVPIQRHPQSPPLLRPLAPVPCSNVCRNLRPPFRRTLHPIRVPQRRNLLRPSPKIQRNSRPNFHTTFR